MSSAPIKSLYFYFFSLKHEFVFYFLFFLYLFPLLQDDLVCNGIIVQRGDFIYVSALFLAQPTLCFQKWMKPKQVPCVSIRMIEVQIHLTIYIILLSFETMTYVAFFPLLFFRKVEKVKNSLNKNYLQYFGVMPDIFQHSYHGRSHTNS